MKQSQYWKPVLNSLIGVVIGLGWVYWCCRENPDMDNLGVAGWTLALRSLILTICALLILAVSRTTPSSRKVRNQLLTGCTLVASVGSFGILFGLGWVFLMCLMFAYEHDTWAQ